MEKRLRMYIGVAICKEVVVLVVKLLWPETLMKFGLTAITQRLQEPGMAILIFR